MNIGSVVRYFAVLAGIAAPGLAITPVLAGVAAERPEAPAMTKQACSTSTHSIRQLAMIDHTSDGGFQCIGVFVEGETVKAIRLEKHSFAAASGQPQQERIRVVEFPVTTLDSSQGAVIDGIPGHDAIVLHGHPADKGELVISYLYNGLTGEFHNCRIVLDRSSTGWRLVNRLDQPVSLIGVRIRQIPFIGVVGIDNLEGACN